MDIEALHMFVDIARMGSLSAVARARDVDPDVRPWNVTDFG
jgi:DNA-binding transcriptional LysR family regulator